MILIKNVSTITKTLVDALQEQGHVLNRQFKILQLQVCSTVTRTHCFLGGELVHKLVSILENLPC